jgi:hypothetical protein
VKEAQRIITEHASASLMAERSILWCSVFGGVKKFPAFFDAPPKNKPKFLAVVFGAPFGVV